jgi:hypothetical protein
MEVWRGSTNNVALVEDFHSVYCSVPTMTTEGECKCELAGYSSRSSRGKFTVTFVHESSLSESRLLQTLLPIYFALACLTLTKSPWHTTNNLHPE